MPQFLEFFHNHLPLFAAAAAVMVLLIANEVVGAITGEKKLGALDAVRLINDRDALIVDLRPANDFKRGHLLHAISVPVAKLDERVSDLGKDKSRPLVLYCALGSVATQAATKLKKLGFAEPYPLKGGINGWIGASLPVTTK